MKSGLSRVSKVSAFSPEEASLGVTTFRCLGVTSLRVSEMSARYVL